MNGQAWIMHQVKNQASLCEICCGQRSSGKGFPPSTLVKQKRDYDKAKVFPTLLTIAVIYGNYCK
jgi:hypothetical protein